jgi:ribosomal-protein-alanine N-acetyltransferase
VDNLIISPIKFDNLEQIFDTENKLYVDQSLWKKEEYAKFFQLPEYLFLGLYHKKELLGWIALDPYTKKGIPMWNITTITVEPLFQGQGLGELLLLATFEILQKQEGNVLELQVSESNSVARKLYDKYGFQEVGRIPEFYDNGNDALVLHASNFKGTEFRNLLKENKKKLLSKHSYQIGKVPVIFLARTF